MKTSEIIGSAVRRREGGVDDDAGPDLVQALDDHVLALREARRR